MRGWSLFYFNRIFHPIAHKSFAIRTEEILCSLPKEHPLATTACANFRLIHENLHLDSIIWKIFCNEKPFLSNQVFWKTPQVASMIKSCSWPVVTEIRVIGTNFVESLFFLVSAECVKHEWEVMLSLRKTLNICNQMWKVYSSCKEERKFWAQNYSGTRKNDDEKEIL